MVFQKVGLLASLVLRMDEIHTASICFRPVLVTLPSNGQIRAWG